MSEHFSDEISNEPQLPRRSKMIAWATLGVLGAAAAAGGLYATASNGSTPSAPTVTAQTATAQTAAGTSDSPSATPSPSAKSHDQGGRRGPGGPGMAGRGFGGLGGPGGLGGLILGGPGGQVLHGESTVATAKGGTEIVDTQRGTVSAIDANAKTITVTSTDKVAFTYVVDAKTRLIDFAVKSTGKAAFGDLKVGDLIEIAAIRSGETRTATSVIDGTPTRGKVTPHRTPGGPRPLASPPPSAAATATSA